MSILRGEYRFIHIHLFKPQVILEFNSSGVSNFQFKSSGSNEPSALPVLAFRDIRIKKGRFMYSDQKSNTDLSLDLDRLQADIPGLDKPIQIQLQGVFRELPCTLDGSIGPIMAWIKPGHPLPVDLTAGLGKTAAQLEGSIRDPIHFNGLSFEFSVTGNDLSILNNAYGTHFKNKIPIHIAGRFEDHDPRSYSITSLQANYGDSNLTGTVSINMATDRPAMKAQLSSRKIDLRSILETFRKTALSPDKSNKSPGNKDRVFSRQPFSLAVLDRLDADVTFRNQELLTPKFAFKNIDVNLRLKNGDLSVYPLKFTIGGGSAEGKLNLLYSKKVPSLKVVMDIKQLDLGPMLEQLEYEVDLKGRMNAFFDLAGKGNSVAAQMEGLNGKVFISMRGGQTHNKNLAKLEKYLGGNVLELLNPFQKKSPHTTINCLVNTMNIKDGNVDYKLALDTNQTALLVAGSIDLKTEGLDIGIKPTPKKSAGRSGAGSISFSLSKLSRPFRLGGTLAKPKLVIDPTRTVFTAGKFAGAMALGPTGLVLFFSDISVGKKNICEEAFETLQSE
jgi:uncharacterized protein involved in outer membrane biogenesis